MNQYGDINPTPLSFVCEFSNEMKCNFDRVVGRPSPQNDLGGTGVKTLYIYRWVRTEGKAERIMLGRFPDMTIENARKATTKVNGAIAEGHNPAAASRGKRAELTLGELWLF